MKLCKQILRFLAVTAAIMLAVYLVREVNLARKRGWYPMGGEAVVIDKYEEARTLHTDYYIVIEQQSGTEFTLSCSELEYCMVRVGDTISCYRDQHVPSYTGRLERIESINGEKVEYS